MLVFWAAYGLLLLAVVAGAIADWRTGLVPNRITVGGMAVGLVLWTVVGLWRGGVSGAAEGATAAMLGAAVGYVPMLVIVVLGGLGGGDAKLMGAVGALGASWRMPLMTLFYALIVGMVMALMLMVRTRRTRRTASRLLGAALMRGAKVRADLEPEADEPRVPFAAAIAVGAAVAGAEVLLGLTTPWAGLHPGAGG